MSAWITKAKDKNLWFASPILIAMLVLVWLAHLSRTLAEEELPNHASPNETAEQTDLPIH